VWELKEITAFLELTGTSDDFREQSYKNWHCDFALAVDILSRMKEQKTKLQEKDKFVQDMYTNIKAFKSKRTLFSRKTSTKSFTHFPTLVCRERRSEMRRNTANYGETFTEN